MVKIKRWNQPRHFHNWFCGNDACDYSRVARAVNALEVEDILEAQEMGHARPVLPKVPQAPSKWPPPYISRHPSHNTEQADLLNVLHLDATASAAATEVPTKEGAEKATDGPSPGPSSAPTSPKSWVDITTLSDTVQKEIRDLRIKINRLGTKKSMWWSKEETQLLGLYRNFKLPIHQITSVSTPTSSIRPLPTPLPTLFELYLPMHITNLA